MNNYQPLFQPFELSSNLSLANRVVMAPMTRSMAPGHIPNQAIADYYAKRAAGGVGLIITEGTIVHPTGHGYPDVPNFFGEEALEGWRKVVNAVHAEGGKIAPQLWHVGSVHGEGTPLDPNYPKVAPSAIAHPGNAGVESVPIPDELSTEAVEEIINAFAEAAAKAKQIGFDAVELHGAHGYLIDQFFWDKTNQRQDRFGGATLAERTTFARELITAVRKQVGDDFPIILRLSQWKIGDYVGKLAKTPEELAAWLTPLADAGVDIFHMSTRRFWEPEFADSPLNLAGWAKKITGKPSITVGSIGLTEDFIDNRYGGMDAKLNANSLQIAANGITHDEYDLVAVGRMLISNSDWPLQLQRQSQYHAEPFIKEHLEMLV